MSSPGSRVATYFRRARLIDELRLSLRSPSSSRPPPPPDDPVVAFYAIRAAPTAASALAFFRAIPTPAPLPLFQALAARLANPASLPDLHSLLASFPLPPPPLLRLRLLAAAGDHPAALAAFASVPADPHRPADAHNLVIRLHAGAGNHAAAVDAFGAMLREGALPNTRTYTILLHHLAAAGFLDQALEVFRLLPSLRVPRIPQQYNVLAEALAEAGRFNRLRWLVREMVAVDGIMPRRQMRAAIAAMREAGHTEGTEGFVEELLPSPYAVCGSEGEGDSEEEAEDGDTDQCGANKETQQLKPWLHPRELARALEGWHPEDVAELEAAGIVWTPPLVSKLLSNFRKATTAWKFFCWVACRPGSGFRHDLHTVARMIGIFACAGKVELAEGLLAKVRTAGILLPFLTVRRIINFYGLSKKANAAVRVFREADSICGPVSRPNLALLCSSLLWTMLKCHRVQYATELLEEMVVTRGVVPDLQTISGVMEHVAGAGILKGVHRLLGLVRQCELRPDGHMYVVLIRAYCKGEHTALAVRVFDEMRGAGIAPDSPTVALLVKTLWREGKLREAALVLERCEEMVAACGGRGLPAACLGHTTRAADLNKVYGIYSGCFGQQPDAENLTANQAIG
ncbi:pentatricopeptide repeat-containing protein At5g66631-like [Lolium rigidum]|uniref:pentatricopeptide repeat-containing protein At5g66631-like n=1 Tax=Lolium rigidum TaxID=89674 RepID=UPI001F5DDE64|nr:pentatricopeptide repeat-containing protein At5g66631-like [Lolium rigidum]